jgi:hypothetical protein
MVFAGIRPTGDEMACAGIVRDGHMVATSVWANKTANSFAGIRPWMPRRYSPDGWWPVFARTGGGITLPVFAPTGVHLWYKKNNNRNNDKCKLME